MSTIADTIKLPCTYIQKNLIYIANTLHDQIEKIFVIVKISMDNYDPFGWLK
jgi:hypothetical protein